MMTKSRILIGVFIIGMHMGCTGLNGKYNTASVQESTQQQTGAVEKKVIFDKQKKRRPLTKMPDEGKIVTQSTLPAVIALISDAHRDSRTGNLDAAAATIERALRLEPRNAAVVYELANIRIKQHKPRLAEDLARKSVLLSANDLALKQRSWLLIALARQMQGNKQGAVMARKKAAALFDD